MSAVLPDAGSSDLRAAADALRSRLPEPLAPLATIAYNYRWSWTPGGPELFASIDAERWELCLGNPVRLLQEVHPDTLARVAGDAAFLARIAELEQAVGAEGAEPITPAGVTPEHPVAFFCAEYAIHGSLPVYSGGLGVLAGDILKESSDRRVPLVAVGLMYRHGYFRQRIDGSGWQHEYWVDTDPDRVPAALVTGADGAPLTVAVPVAGRDVVAQIWRVDVGRVPLLLLDADRPENSATDRWITSRLYVGDPTVRLWQYALLGVGGVRALHALGVEPSVVHLNEGHAALAGLELARAATADGSVAADEALAAARERTVFTTHTPVPAGNDAYPAGQIAGVLAPLAGDLGIDIESLIGLGRTHPDEPAEPFGVTQFALRTSRTANAVSARHGEVAREMWNDLWPDRAVDEVPIGHVTNGVHIPTWIGAPMRELLDRHLGAGWADRATNPETWAAVDSLPAEELWAARSAQRRELLELVCERSVTDRLGRGDTLEYVRAAAEALDPEALTLGFARRVATYKRLDLLLQRGRPRGRAARQRGPPGPDDPRRQGASARRRRQAARPAPVRHEVPPRGLPPRRLPRRLRLRLGAAMTRGCDVWVNVPRPPLEASGTSGMKSAINAGLQLAVLDGWWPEAYDGTNGWAISGEVDHDHGAQDWRHAAELYRLISDEVIPAFYDRDEAGLPQAWLSMVRSSLRACGPRFGAGRMVEDYAARIYPPG